MSHVVCDICGTSYDPKETCCPLCGKKRDERDLLVQEPEGRKNEPEEPRKVTKGGRFSPKNVERNNREREAAAAMGARNLFRETPEHRPEPPREEPYPDEPKEPRRSGKAVVAVLSAAVVLLGCYIIARFVLGRPASSSRETTPETSASTTAETKPCTSITLGTSGIKLKQVGETYLLTVKAQPEGTTDQVSFVSGNERVAKVSADGVVTCTGPGETKITVTCGKVSVVCKVTCAVQETDGSSSGTTHSTKETQKPTDPKDDRTNSSASLNIEDMTLFYSGETAELALRNAKGTVTWSVDDPSVATVSKDGTVTAVGYGTTTVRAAAGGKTYTCIVRCYFNVQTDPPATEPTTKPTTEPTTEPATEPTTEPTSEPTTEPAAEDTTAPAENGGITSDENT